jgi:hypothetical protein
MHPRDRDNGDPQTPMTMMYFGAAGVIWALDQLGRVGAAPPCVDFAPALGDILARNLAIVEPWGHGVEGLLMGQSGILLLRYRLAPDDATADAIAASIAIMRSPVALRGLPSSCTSRSPCTNGRRPRAGQRCSVPTRRRSRRCAAPPVDTPCHIWTPALQGRRYLGAGRGIRRQRQRA